MVELFRTSRILQRATSRSLVVLDELGRGTSTHDGVAIAKATLKYFVNRIGCAVLFVTHFLQVSDMIESETTIKNRAVNVHMAFLNHVGDDSDVIEAEEQSSGSASAKRQKRNEGNESLIDLSRVQNETGLDVGLSKNRITFMYKVAESAADSSYGLNVARLVGFDEQLMALASEKSEWMRKLSCER